MAIAILDAIRSFFKPVLDPGRSRRVFEKFDEARGYAEYHRACQARFGGSPDFSSDSTTNLDAVTRRGFEHFEAMDSNTAIALRKELDSRFPIVSVKRDKPELVGYDIDDEAFRNRLITAALSPGVDDRIVHYFGSDYRVHWFQVARTEAGGGTASFLWHCDQGPSVHLKLIVYLNDASEHDANTELLDLATTEALCRVGYTFGPTATRSDDLTALLAQEQFDYRPESRLMAPGDSILFQPSRVAHRGVSPTHGQRTTLTLCLIPSLVPWRAALADGGMFDLRRNEKWHADARTLLNRRGESTPAS